LTLEPGSEVASKYLVEEALPGELSRPAYQGKVVSTGQRVNLFVVTASEAPTLAAAADVEHAHLAKLVDMVEREAGERVAIVEAVDGQTLEEHLRANGALSAVAAARALLCVADALEALHQAGATHGLLSPGAVIAVTSGRPAPVVTYVPLTVAAAPYRSPRRGSDEPPAAEDDTWALAALLFEMVTGKAPPAGGLRRAEEAAEAGIEDEDLCQVLAHGLAADEGLRTSDVSGFKRELAHWFAGHDEAEDEQRSPSAAPPPLPASAPPAASSTVPPAEADARMRRLLGMAAVALPLGVLVAWGLSRLIGGGAEVADVPSSAPEPQPAASASAPSIDLSDVPVTGATEVAAGSRMAVCVAGYLPKGAFEKKAPDVGWVCEESDPRAGGNKLRSAVVTGAGGKVTDAMKLVSKLGWYQMAAYAVVHAGCCADAKPLELPPPGPSCPRMDVVLRDLGASVVAERDHEQAMTEFAEAVQCEVRAKRHREFGQKGAPSAAQKQAFEDLVKLLRAP
jgi:hypothetical protein